MSSSRVVEAMVEDVRDASSVDDFRFRVLGHLGRLVGFDSAVFLDERPERGRPVAVNKERAPYFFGLYASHPERYQRSLYPLLDEHIGEQGACLDTEVFSKRERDRLPFYADIVRPQGITSQLIARIGFRGTPLGRVYLCRHGRFGALGTVELEQLRRLVPIVGTLEAALHSAQPRVANPRLPSVMLTTRERQIAGHVARGLRNRDIALVFGTSVNTVRNQLAALYEKLGIASRAELAAWAIHRRIED